MAEAIVILNADDPYTANIIQHDGANRVFGTPELALAWVDDNARNGWTVQIVELA